MIVGELRGELCPLSLAGDSGPTECQLDTCAWFIIDLDDEFSGACAIKFIGQAAQAQLPPEEE